MLGIVGNTSIIECAVNHKYYEQKGYFIIGSGIAPECYSTPNSAAVNMGPRYSVDGATQYLIRQGVKKLVLDQSNVPGHRLHRRRLPAHRQGRGIPTETLKDNVPIQDANSVALKDVQAAGDGGGVVLNFTPPEALKILQAAQQLGLQDRVKWACSTPCNTDFLARGAGVAVGRQAGRQRRAEPDDGQRPRQPAVPRRAEEVRAEDPARLVQPDGLRRGADRDRGAARASRATYTPRRVNAAFKGVKDFKTDILCKPWYYGNAPLHIPNNTDRTTTPKGGVMVEKEGCFPISDVDPAIAQVRKIEASGGNAS